MRHLDIYVDHYAKKRRKRFVARYHNKVKRFSTREACYDWITDMCVAAALRSLKAMRDYDPQVKVVQGNCPNSLVVTFAAPPPVAKGVASLSDTC